MYQSSAASTVTDNRGSRRRWPNRTRVSSMLTSTRSSSSRRYQVATVTGAPSDLRVATTAGLAAASSSRTWSGNGSVGMPSP